MEKSEMYVISLCLKVKALIWGFDKRNKYYEISIIYFSYKYYENFYLPKSLTSILLI